MKTSDAAAHFGSKYKVAQELGINQSNLTRWKNKVPEVWARRLHDMTGGKLHFDIKEYPIKKRTWKRR
jgi:hypothetical protein